MRLQDFKPPEYSPHTGIKRFQTVSYPTINGIPFQLVQLDTITDGDFQMRELTYELTYSTIANHKLYEFLVVDNRPSTATNSELNKIITSFTFLSPPVLQDPNAKLKAHIQQC